MQDFRKLKIWERSLVLTEKIYKLTTEFPKDEKYGLTSQMRRAASSIGANIAEGAARETNKDFKRFLNIAVGSSAELDYFLELANRLNYLNTSNTETILVEVNNLRKMIISLSKKLTI